MIDSAAPTRLQDAYCPNAACPALGIARRPAWLGSVHGAAVLRCPKCRRRYHVTADATGVAVRPLEGRGADH